GSPGATAAKRDAWPTSRVWQCYLPEARPGQLYGYRVHGPYAPEEGHRLDPNKRLLDPYAKAYDGTLNWSDAHFGYEVGSEEEDLSFDTRDNAADMLKCRVIDPASTWGDARSPNTSWQDTVIYEPHDKGLTMQQPAVPER